jgi:hypothetical protein
MRNIGSLLLVVALPFSLGLPQSLWLVDGVRLPDLESYDYVPLDMGEWATLDGANLDTQPYGEPISFDHPGTSQESDDLLGTMEYASFNPLDSSDATNALGPSPGSPDQVLIDAFTYDFGKDVIALNPLDYLGSVVDDIFSLFSKAVDECDGDRVPLCCTVNLLPWAQKCIHFDGKLKICRMPKNQYCCAGYNALDREGVDCTKGFKKAEPATEDKNWCRKRALSSNGPWCFP